MKCIIIFASIFLSGSLSFSFPKTKIFQRQLIDTDKKNLDKRKYHTSSWPRKNKALVTVEGNGITLFGESGNGNNPIPKKSAVAVSLPAQFDYQEMKILLETMQEKKIPSRNLQVTKRKEIEQYVKNVINNRPSTPAVWTSSMFQEKLPGTMWRLAFTTESTTLNDLPRDATIYIKFIDYDTLEYRLQFSENTFGLKSIQAACTWKADSAGLITFVYKKVMTDMFGMKDMNISVFGGFLKGRVNYIETVYYDDVFLIEQGYVDDAKNSKQQQDFINVYMKVQDKEDMW